MYTAGRLAKRFHLSRTALLYYDSIGLLKPSGRSESHYRQYCDSDALRLEKICRFRDAGLRLKDIRRVLDSPRDSVSRALEERLEELNGEIERLRNQQRFILGLLKGKRFLARVRVMNKLTWKALLKASGFTYADMQQWHVDFERLAPEKHQQFLEFLCMPASEIERLRAGARQRPREGGLTLASRPRRLPRPVTPFARASSSPGRGR